MLSPYCNEYSSWDAIICNEKYKTLSITNDITSYKDKSDIKIIKRQESTYLIYATCDHDTWWFFVKGYSSDEAYNYLKQIVENVKSSEEMVKKLMCSYYPNIVRYLCVPDSIRTGNRKFEIGDGRGGWLSRFGIKYLNSNTTEKFLTLERVMSFIELNHLTIKDLKFDEYEVWFEVETFITNLVSKLKK